MKSNPVEALIAEDNPADVFLVRTALEEAGLDVRLREFANGEQVLEFLDRVDRGEETAQPQLFLLDLNLPRYGGEEVLERLRRSPACGSAAVVIVTSSDSPADRGRAEALGVAHYFRKPSDFDAYLELGRIVKRVLASAPAPE